MSPANYRDVRCNNHGFEHQKCGDWPRKTDENWDFNQGFHPLCWATWPSPGLPAQGQGLLNHCAEGWHLHDEGRRQIHALDVMPQWDDLDGQFFRCSISVKEFAFEIFEINLGFWLPPQVGFTAFKEVHKIMILAYPGYVAASESNSQSFIHYRNSNIHRGSEPSKKNHWFLVLCRFLKRRALVWNILHM